MVVEFLRPQICSSRVAVVVDIFQQCHRRTHPEEDMRILKKVRDNSLGSDNSLGRSHTYFKCNCFRRVLVFYFGDPRII